MAQNDTWTEVRKIHRDYKMFYQGSGRVLLVVLGILVVKAIFQNDGDFIKNFSMEALSLLATVLVLDWLAERRDERRKIEELKERLLVDIRSQSNEAAKRAVDELQHRGWLWGEHGLLKDAYLENANLEGAYLRGGNLEETRLQRAKLQKADLRYANLRGAHLWDAKLQKADLHQANLQGANLAGADLQGADLEGDVQGANLAETNLENTKLINTRFDEYTILPDGSNWTPNTDMSRFTDRHHPEFWRSQRRASPAYRKGDS